MSKAGILGNLFMMNIQQKNILLTGAIITIVFFVTGCGEPTKTPQLGIPKADTDATIGSVSEITQADTVPVEGYSLMLNLKGTGSQECPKQIRQYLEKYIAQRIPNIQDVEKFITSRNTAVVYLEGLMPTGAPKDERFDIKVTALHDTETTSLEGGSLYNAEFFEKGRFGTALKPVALGNGQIYIDKMDPAKIDLKTGYIPGGGKVLEPYNLSLVLKKPDFLVANRIRNILIERFGNETAKAISENTIIIKIPDRYKGQKQRFLSVIKAIYINEQPQVTQQRIKALVRNLAITGNESSSEIALEAIGTACIGDLSALLNSSDEEIQLKAATCLLNLGSDQGLNTLRNIAMNKDSVHRNEALISIAASGRKEDIAAIGRILLRDENFDIRLAACEQLEKLDDITINRIRVDKSFYIEEIVQTKQKSIFASRSGVPRIVLFGSPILCRKNIFVQSPDKKITVNAPAGQNYLLLMCENPQMNLPPIQAKCSFDLRGVIKTLAAKPAQGGLGVYYADIMALLKEMCEKNAIGAEFRAGPLPKIEQTVKK